MKKFVRKGLQGTNIYPAPTGQRYVFSDKFPTKIYDKKDIEYFDKNEDYEEYHAVVEKAKKVAGKAKKIGKDENKEYDDFLKGLKGVDEEISKILKGRYPNRKDFLDNITEYQLIDISGIGKKRASDIITQVEAIKIKERGE